MATMTKATKTFPVFDADSHVVEQAAIWKDYLEPEYRVLARSCFWHEDAEIAPITILNGKPVGELNSPNLPRYAIWRPGMTPQDVGRLDPRQRHPMSPGATDAAARLRDMDAMGVDQALLFPTLFAEYFPVVENPDVAAALARAYNNWVLDFCNAAPDRLFPVAVLPLQDVNFAVREAKRTAGLGFRAAMFRPLFNNNRYPAQAYYWPLWKEMESLGMTVCAHSSTGPAAAEMDANAPFIERVTLNLNLGHPVGEFVAPAMDNATFLVTIMADGLMEKYPRLRMLFAHSGIGWLLVALEKTETYLWLSHQEVPVSLEPEHIFFARQNMVTFPARDGSVRRMSGVLEKVGTWGSRYPAHDTSTAWDAIRDLQTGSVAGATIERLMGGNAARVLGVKPLLHVKSEA